MAISYTDFMAAGGMLNTNEVVRDVSDTLHEILLKDTATLGQIPGRGTATNTKHEWLEDALNPVTFTAAYTASTNTLVISDPSTSANLSKIVRTGALVFTEGQTFVLKFGSAPAVGSNTMTVYDGTDADVASGTWYVICLPYSDHAGLSEDIARPRTLRWNSPQVFERSMQIGKTRRGLESYAVGSGDKDFQKDITNRTFEAKREMNIAVISSVPYYDSGSAAYTHITERPSMAGLIKLIRDPDLDAVNEDTTVIDADSGYTNDTISADMLNDLVYKVFDKGGLDESAKPCFIMHHMQKQKLSAIFEEIRRTTREDMTVGYSVDVFHSSLGIKIPVVVDRYMPRDQAILLDKSRVRLMTFKGDTWNLVKVALPNSRMDAYQLSGQFVLELANAEEAHGLIVGLDVN